MGPGIRMEARGWSERTGGRGRGCESGPRGRRPRVQCESKVQGYAGGGIRVEARGRRFEGGGIGTKIS